VSATTNCEQKLPARQNTASGRYATEKKNQVSATKTTTLGVRAALFALSCYKAYLSVLFAGTCRFEPTCSRYAYEAIERFGVARGVWLGLKRLLRCHPLSGKFGYDPVPEKWEEMQLDTSATRIAIDRSKDRPLQREVRS
jgi:hypothetical protein